MALVHINYKCNHRAKAWRSRKRHRAWKARRHVRRRQPGKTVKTTALWLGKLRHNNAAKRGVALKSGGGWRRKSWQPKADSGRRIAAACKSAAKRAALAGIAAYGDNKIMERAATMAANISAACGETRSGACRQRAGSAASWRGIICISGKDKRRKVSGESERAERAEKKKTGENQKRKHEK